LPASDASAKFVQTLGNFYEIVDSDKKDEVIKLKKLIDTGKTFACKLFLVLWISFPIVRYFNISFLCCTYRKCYLWGLVGICFLLWNICFCKNLQEFHTSNFYYVYICYKGCIFV